MHAWLIVAVIAAAAWTCACRRASGPVWTLVLGLCLLAVTSGTAVPHSIATFLWIVFALAEQRLTGSVGGWFGPAVAFFGGVVSFLSPCVLPLVPAYLVNIAGEEIGRAHV